MKITKIETIPIRLPTRRVHQWASLTTPIGVYVIIKLYTDEGRVGLGEAPVLKDWGGDHGKYFGETPQTTMHIINDILAPALAGQDPSRFESIHALMDKTVKGYPYCKAAIDAALYDVVGNNEGQYQLLGGLFASGCRSRTARLMESTKLSKKRAGKVGRREKLKLKAGVDRNETSSGKQIAKRSAPILNLGRREQPTKSEGRGEKSQGDGGFNFLQEQRWRA